MIASLGFVAVYVALVGVASFIERPAGRGLGPFQLNVLIRGGSLVAALAALIGTHWLALPSAPWLLAGIGIGLITGVGSIFYCLALDYMPVSLVVTFSNLYIVITILLGVVVLHEHVTALKIVGLACTLGGILSSNAYIVVTVVLSTIFLRQPLTRARGAAVALTLVGVTLLALSA